MSDSRRKALPTPDIPVIKLITWTSPLDVGSLSVKPRRALDNLAVHASQDLSTITLYIQWEKQQGCWSDVASEGLELLLSAMLQLAINLSK